jgi:hypothetical protein
MSDDKLMHGSSAAAARVCKVLGLPDNAQSIVFRLEAARIATVTVEFMPTEAQALGLVDALAAEYELVKREVPKF